MEQRTLAMQTVTGNAGVEPAQSLSLRVVCPLGGVLLRRDDLGSAQRTARRRNPCHPQVGGRAGRGTPGEELSDSWARSSLPCRRAPSPTASLRQQQPWDLTGCWVLGARSGVAPAILILERETEKQGPWELGGQRPAAGAGPEW